LIDIWEEKSHTVQAEEAMMVHEAEDKAVEGEDLETTSQRPTPRAAKLWR
jgi:hypothetical protein